MQDCSAKRPTHGGRLSTTARTGIVAALCAVALSAASTMAQAQLVPQPGVNSPISFADIVEKVKPSVVSISVTSGGRNTRLSRNEDDQGGQGRNGATPFPDLAPDHPLNEFFKNLPGRRGQQGPAQRVPRRASQGSGFVISEDGYVVTNNHVVNGAEEIKVSFEADETYDAKLIGTDPRTDLALLKIQSDKRFAAVKFANEIGRVGDWVVAVGNPFGLGGTVTVGILSALSRDIGSGPYDFIQIDAAVNRGNSGGPTFNLKGEVIGVNTAIYSPSGGNVGIAFAVPATTAVSVIEELKKNGEVRRGWLGVRIQNVDKDIAASLGLENPSGALINDVTKDGPAEKAGLQAGDAILKVDGEVIRDSRDLARKIADYAPNTKVNVEVRRGARDVTIPVNLGMFPSNTDQAAPTPGENTPQREPQTSSIEDLGLSLSALTEPRGEVKQGVVIAEVREESDAAQKGLTAGDVIVQVNSQPVSSIADVEAAVKKAKELNRPAVLLTVEGQSGRRLVAVQFKKSG